MDLKLDGVNNAGWSFTEIRLRQLHKMFMYISQFDNNHKFIYREIQEKISAFDSSLDSSKVRMFFPWLEYYGVINSYEDIQTYGELYTDLGLGFVKFLSIYLDSKDNEDEYSKIQIQSIHETLLTFVNNFYFNLITTQKGKIHKLVIEVLEKVDYLTYNEFFIVTHSVKNNLDFDWILENISEMRNYNTNLNIEIVSNRNAWGYIIPFLKEAGLITEEKRVIYLK